MDGYSWIALLTVIATVFAVWKIRKDKDYTYSTLDISGIIIIIFHLPFLPHYESNLSEFLNEIASIICSFLILCLNFSYTFSGLGDCHVIKICAYPLANS